MSSALAPLWHIEEHLQALMDTVEACPDELKPEIQAEIDAYLGQEVTKVDQVAHVLAALDYEQKCAADEIARLQERKKAAKAAQDRLEQYVCRVIKMRGVKKLEGKTNSLSVRPSDAVIVTSADEVPDLYKTASVKMPLGLWHGIVGVVLSFAPDDIRKDLDGLKADETISLTAIKRDLKTGVVIPGADLEFRDNLQRK